MDTALAPLTPSQEAKKLVKDAFRALRALEKMLPHTNIGADDPIFFDMNEAKIAIGRIQQAIK